MKTFQDYLVTLGNGSIDRDASLASLIVDFENYVNTQVKLNAEVVAGVDKVFSEGKNKPIPMEAFVFSVLNTMGVKMEDFEETKSCIEKYLRDNSKGDAPKFKIIRGKNGGVCRAEYASSEAPVINAE